MIQRLRQFERQKESGEELGMDESELKTGNKGETEAEEMGDENLEVTTSMVKQAAEKKKVCFDVVGRVEFQKTVHIFIDAIKLKPWLST